MRVILDTNVFVSGLFWSGAPYEILKAWRDKKLQLVLSPEIFSEYQRVFIQLETKYPELQTKPFLDLVALNAEFCNPIPINEFYLQRCRR